MAGAKSKPRSGGKRAPGKTQASKPAPQKATLDRAAILAADDLAREVVFVPEWGGTVFVRVMTAAERDRFEIECLVGGQGIAAAADGIGVRARLAIATVCDENGVALFTPDDGLALAGKSGAALDAIYPVASRLNRLTDEDVEGLVKN